MTIVNTARLIMRTRNPHQPPPLVPRAFRRRLSPTRLAEISLVHHINLDALRSAERGSLLNFAGSVLTWGFVVKRFGLAETEMEPLYTLVDTLLHRFASEGHLTLTDQEYVIARDGVIVMDLIAAEADMETAAWAAERSTAVLRAKVAALMTADSSVD